METKRTYRVKREDLDTWVPQYWDILTDRVPIFATDGTKRWQDFSENGERVTFGSREEGQAYIDKQQAGS